MKANWGEADFQKEIERHERVAPIIARMGQSVGFAWYQLSSEARSSIMEMVDGSFGLDERVVDWAEEFDRVWEEREAIIKSTALPDGDDYPERLAEFVDGKFKALLAEARLS